MQRDEALKCEAEDGCSIPEESLWWNPWKGIGAGAMGSCWSLKESDHTALLMSLIMVDTGNCEAFKRGNGTTRFMFYKKHYREAREWIQGE